MEDENNEEKIDFNEIRDSLLDASRILSPKYLLRLSDLEEMELKQFSSTWLLVSPLRRQRLLEDLEQIGDTSTIVDFDPIFKLGLKDENAQVRQVAIRGLWENEEPEVARSLIKILKTDHDPDVCAQAASGLGKFLFLGELGDISQELTNQITQLLIDICERDEPEIVRRRATEALGFTSHPKATEIIENAYNKQKENWVLSAIIAMGRSANNQWVPQIIENLTHEESEIRTEAAQSAGLLGAQETVSHLLQMIDDPEEDVKLAAIWALSEVGGMDARAALEGLANNSRDDAELEYLEEALENLAFNEVSINFDMFDLSEEDLDDFSDTDDDSDDDDDNDDDLETDEIWEEED